MAQYAEATTGAHTLYDRFVAPITDVKLSPPSTKLDSRRDTTDIAEQVLARGYNHTQRAVTIQLPSTRIED